MTTERQLVRAPLRESRESREGSDGAPGARLRRLHRRQRLFREEMLAVLVLFLVLAVTVAVLATQWLASASAPNVGGSAPPPINAHQLGGAT